jgi:hypothetical protein
VARTLSPDTRPEAEAVQLELLRRMGGERRAALMRSLTRTVRRLAREAIRRDHPGLDDTEVTRRLLAICYGDALADKVAARVAARR